MTLKKESSELERIHKNSLIFIQMWRLKRNGGTKKEYIKYFYPYTNERI